MDKEKSISKSLTEWYQTNKRPLPWRLDPDPYRVWISEIMLQQTVVKAVIPHFEQWMEAWPDVTSLAKADEQDVVRMWEGLGYYRRARNIQRAAKLIVSQHLGQIPDNYQDLLKLPGIGEYTASAILSIAFHQPYPSIDANLRRVLRRILGIRELTNQVEVKLRKSVEKMMIDCPPADLNQGLMELGQTICLPANPKCDLCPVGSQCVAKAENLQEEIPGSKQKQIIPKATILILLVSNQGLLMSKKSTGIMKGLWVFPAFQVNLEEASAWQGIYSEKKDKTQDQSGSSPELRIENYIEKDFTDSFHFAGSLKPRVHHYTKFADRLFPFVYQSESYYIKKNLIWEWIPVSKIDTYPVASVYRQIINEFRAVLGGNKYL